MEQETNGVEEKYPFCSHCGCDIICAVEDMKPFTIIVRDPFGKEHVGGQFCGICIVKLVMFGVLIHPLPPDLAAAREETIRAKAVQDEG